MRVSGIACRASVAALVIGALAPGANAQTVTVEGTPTPLVVAKPRGYIGIVHSGEQRVQTSQQRHNDRVVERKVLVSYSAYPVIVSVEPGSPAERAGLLAGDTVLAYNDNDVVREPFPLYELLQPGTRINMRLRRNGKVRNTTVTVAPRPQGWGQSMLAPGAAYMPSPEVAAQVRREVERAQEQLRRELERNRELTEREREQLERTVTATAAARARAAVAPMVFTTASFSGVAGAEMTTLNEDLAELVGSRRGVFVVKVNPGTPAEQAGLRGGDVIIAVGDSAVNDVSQLRRAINVEQRRIRTAKAAREISLEIVRKHRKQKVALKY